MTTLLYNATVSGNLAAVKEALPGAAPAEIDRALVSAAIGKRDAVFDFLLPLAPNADGAVQYCLSISAGEGYLHALRALLPQAEFPHRIGMLAINQKQDAAAMLVIAAYPGSFNGDDSSLDRALLNSSADVVHALARLLDPLPPKTLISIAILRPEVVGALALDPDAARAAIESILVPSARDLTPEPHLRGADALLALVPFTERLEVIEAHPALRSQPVATAALNRAQLEILESEVSAGAARPLPRM